MPAKSKSSRTTKKRKGTSNPKTTTKRSKAAPAQTEAASVVHPTQTETAVQEIYYERQTVVEAYGVKDADGKFVGAQHVPIKNTRLPYGDEKMGLVRPIEAEESFRISFLKVGWDKQFPGTAKLQLTPDLCKLYHSDREAFEAIVRDPASYQNRPVVITDGANRRRLCMESKEDKHEYGWFSLLHPCIPEDRESAYAIASNQIATTQNKPGLSDYLYGVKIFLGRGLTLGQITLMQKSTWGFKLGRISQFRQVCIVFWF